MTDERVLARIDGRWLADNMVDPDVYATGVDDGWNDVELYRLIVRQIQRSFHSGTEADRQTMLASRPHLTGTKWDAAMAAVVEHTARVHGYDPPTWVDEPERFLDEPIKPDQTGNRQRLRLAGRRVPAPRRERRQPGPGLEDRGWPAMDR